MPRAAIGLGSNLEDRHRHLLDAISQLDDTVGAVVGRSSIYETDPVGGPDQGPYLNAVVVVETRSAPAQLLTQLRAIEVAHGRERVERWGPRTLDLDILLYGDVAHDERGLTIPHPHMLERRFVLEPLVEAWPDAMLPDGSSVAIHLDALGGAPLVRFQPRAEPPIQSPPAWAVFVFTAVVGLAIWWLIDLVL